MPIPRVLIVCESRTRSTERVAQAVQNGLTIRGLRCDVELLHNPAKQPLFPRQGDPGTSPETPLRHKTSEYGVVVIGAHASGAMACSQVEAFLDAHAAEIERLALFVVRGAHYEDRLSARIADIARSAPAAVLSIDESALESGQYKKTVRAFTERVEHLARRSSRRASIYAEGAGTGPAEP